MRSPDRLLSSLFGKVEESKGKEQTRIKITGAGGIRTLGTVLPVQRFSKPPHSTTLPPHPGGKPYNNLRASANTDLKCEFCDTS